ncbi:MAG TPA: hypothetical protein VFT76_02075 [Actinomycetota bacterium]|nr:hypothetical protein [Actinomycetota bacterium]
MRTFEHTYAEEVVDRIDRTTEQMTEEWDGTTVSDALAGLRRSAKELVDIYATLLGVNSFAYGARPGLEDALRTIADELEARRADWTAPFLETFDEAEAEELRLLVEENYVAPSAAEVTERRFG